MSLLYTANKPERSKGIKPSAVKVANSTKPFGHQFFSEYFMYLICVSWLAAGGKYERFLNGYFRQLVGELKQCLVVFSINDS